MISRRIAIAFFLIFVSIVSVAILRARGQATARPGDPTQARVWIENRAPAEAVPVIVESVAIPLTVHLDTSSTVQTIATRQTWQYRSVQVPSSAAGGTLDPVGMDGWEAVGILQSSPTTGATVLFKRPR
jgi:hypothetical protein